MRIRTVKLAWVAPLINTGNHVTFDEPLTIEHAKRFAHLVYAKLAGITEHTPMNDPQKDQA